MEKEVIRSVYDNQVDLMQAICELYIGEGFELDPTYNKGIIHRGLTGPEHKADINGSSHGVSTMDVRDLRFNSGSIKSILFDPPFLAGGGKTGIMNNRYSSYETVDDLLTFYHEAIQELERVLSPRGFLVIKCQDICNGRTQTFSHCEIYNMALSRGLYARDLFILTAKNRIKPHKMVNQYHARKHHSYFWIFEKCRKSNKTL